MGDFLPELRNTGSWFVPSGSDTDADGHKGKSPRESNSGASEGPRHRFTFLRTTLDALTPDAWLPWAPLKRPFFRHNIVPLRLKLD